MKMKKLLTFVCILVLALSVALFAACGNSGDDNDNDDTNSDDKKQIIVDDGSDDGDQHYAATMRPYDELTKSDRIVFIQNSLQFSGRAGLYTKAEVAAPENITFEGETVKAYKMSNATKFLHNTMAGNVSIYTNDSANAITMSADQFKAMYVISVKILEVDGAETVEYSDDFRIVAEKPGDRDYEKIVLRHEVILYLPAVDSDPSIVVNDFKCAVTAEGEGVLSVPSNTDIPMTDVLGWFGWDASKTVNLVATDKFYVPDAVSNTGNGKRGTLSGNLSGGIGGLVQNNVIQGGVYDLVYIEKIPEA